MIQKFVIISRSRTGSSYLSSLLDSHLNIECFQERFQEIGGKSCDDVWKDVFFKKRPKGITHVGFKLFYYHPDDSSDRSVWDYIRRDRKIFIIHLKRENILRTVISHKISTKTKKWHKKNEEKEINFKDKKIYFDKYSFFEQFNQTKKWEENADRILARHKMFNLTYEELISDNKKVMKELQKFLGAEELDLETDLIRQNPENLKNLVINYDEMVEEIKTSEWRYLLSGEFGIDKKYKIV